MCRVRPTASFGHLEAQQSPPAPRQTCFVRQRSRLLAAFCGKMRNAASSAQQLEAVLKGYLHWRRLRQTRMVRQWRHDLRAAERMALQEARRVHRHVGARRRASNGPSGLVVGQPPPKLPQRIQRCCSTARLRHFPANQIQYQRRSLQHPRQSLVCKQCQVRKSGSHVPIRSPLQAQTGAVDVSKGSHAA